MDIILDQLGRDLFPLIYEYLPLDLKITLNDEIFRFYEDKNIQRIDTNSDGQRQTNYVLDGLYHGSLGASCVIYDSNRIRELEWYRHGKLHRLNDPAVIRFDPYGNMDRQEWRQNGKLHRVDGPASILYDRRGNIIEKIYYQGRSFRRIIYEWRGGAIYHVVKSDH